MNSKFFKLFLVMFLTQIFITNNLKAQELLFDNGPFTTNTGVGFGGSDVSVLQNVTLGYGTVGYSINNTGNFRLTDQFTNSAPWYLDYVDVFAYQTGSSVSSTFTSGVVKIWNSDPSSGTAISEFGDFTTNRMILTDFTNCYRVQEDVSLLTNNRPIMRIRISIGAIIQPGTHWIEWALTGTLASGPFAPPISILGTGNTGDAKQFSATGYTSTINNGAYQAGIPFKIFGSKFVSYSPSPNAICPGSNVTVYFSDPVVRNTGNSYKLELSDVNGNFPGTVLTTTVVSSSQLSAVIPISTVGSANYKIRTVASSPSENSSPSDFLNVYTAPNAVVTSQTDVSCNGGSNGTASVTASGGTGGYTYSWSPSGGTAATATGLSAGTYTVTVTDANGCKATQNFTITEPTALVATAASQTNVSCNGGSNGAASINPPTGGAGGYTYNWTPGNPTGDGTTSVTGLTPGTWTCTVTDANNCTTAVNFTITQPTALTATAASQTNVSCDAGSNGAASINTPTGGAGGYTYNWTPGNPTGDGTTSVTGLTPGTWTCTVTDANNCTTAVNFTITQPTAISFTTTVLSGYDYNTGYSQTIIASGGTGPKTYAVTAGSLPSGFTLSTAGQITGTSTQITDSNFTVTATDANNCTATYNYVLKLNQIPITVTATPSQTKTYGETDPVLTYTVSPSLLSGDSFTGSLTRISGENIGSYAINQGSLSAGSKYLITYVGANFAITAKPITVTAAPSQTKVYGTTDPAFSYTVSPSLVGNDGFTGVLTRFPGENIGTYTINQGSLSAGSNYTISYAGANFTITAKPITVTATPSQTKVYGTTDPAFSYTVSPGLLGSDAFTGTLIRVSGENIGNYAINQGSLSAGSNYTISYVGTNFTITAKPITVTADASQTKVYGSVNPVYSYTFFPSLVSGDSFTGTLTRAAGENVGVYAITQGTLSAGGNYTITYNGSDFTITKANQVITWNQTLELGCNVETNIILTAVANSGLAVNYASSNADIATVSNNSLIFQNYGFATITASQPGNMNYNAAPSVVLPVVSSQPNLIRKHFEDVIFFDNSSKSFKSYSWYKNGVLVPGQTSQYFKESGPLNGTYYAVATKLDGTLITTCTLTFSPTMEEEYVRIVPNPVRSNTTFQLITNVSPNRLQNARVELYNLTGSLLTTINTSQNTIEMTAPYVEGIYIVKMTLANGKYFTKNLLVRN